EAKKEFDRKLRKAERAVEDAENAVNQIEKRIAEIEESLGNPENASNTALFDEYGKKKHELEQKMYEWEILSEELETIKSQMS
ncbi:MAG: ABC transporter ATP-binding protein, partial [Paludibacteraceae bacterium]|nr:ABC transporter ATP-binding protein [Paludibacteraceae bacterium]